MKVRVLTAIVGIIAVLCLVWLGGWFLTGAVFLVSLIALAEYDRMLKQLSIRIYRIPAAIAIGAVVLSAGFYSVKVFTAVIFLSFCLLLFLILSIKKEEMTNLVYTSFGSLYFGLGFGTLALLRGSRELLPAGAVNGGSGGFFSSSLPWYAPGPAIPSPIWQGRVLGNTKWRPISAPIRQWKD